MYDPRWSIFDGPSQEFTRWPEYFDFVFGRGGAMEYVDVLILRCDYQELVNGDCSDGGSCIAIIVRKSWISICGELSMFWQVLVNRFRIIVACLLCTPQGFQ